MDHPSGGCPPAPGELDKMTTEELLAALDALFGSMTEESYDGALLRAYLDALDRKAPIGAMPTAEESLAAFHSRLETMPARGRFASRPRGARRALRSVFAAAMVSLCIFSGMIAIQAAGIDVFGALARWTGELFSFGDPETGLVAPTPSAAPELTAEYVETLLPDVPAGFVKGEPICFSDDERERFQYALYYTRGDDTILFTAIKGTGRPAVYEKNDEGMTVLDIGGAEFYVFQNSGKSVAVWVVDNLDCSLATNLEIDPLTQILITSYKEEQQ